ncbi:MAG: leucine-rich repeat domain-containing protein, partial [Clostridia bacterium]|nr:leucine-rich repeat domain-containing protein [Clostridia bacterium]
DYCYNLTSIKISSSVTSIGDEAFNSCGSLTSIEIPSSVTSIGNCAFFDCSKLTSVTFGANSQLTSIGEMAFIYCSSLTSINVDENNQNYKSIDGNLYSKDGKTLIQYAIGKTATSFSIPDGVSSIGDYAFKFCRALTSIEIPSSVTSIGGRAFSECISLTSIEIPSSVTSIGDEAFSSCRSLTSVTFKNTSGWEVSRYSDMRDATSLSNGDLADTSTAATYLTSTYCYYYWKRT